MYRSDVRIRNGCHTGSTHLLCRRDHGIKRTNKPTGGQHWYGHTIPAELIKAVLVLDKPIHKECYHGERKKTPAVWLNVLVCASGVLALTSIYHSISLDLRGWSRGYYQGHEDADAPVPVVHRTRPLTLELDELPRLTVPHGVFLFGPDSQSVAIPENERFERNFTSEQLRLLEDHAIDLKLEEKRCAS